MPLTELILRIPTGRPLTAAELDGNFTKIRDFVNSLEQLFGVVLNPDGTLKDGAVGKTDVIADGIITEEKLADDAKLPAGTIMAYAAENVPDGWLECNGQAVSRTADATKRLFAAIGTKWGIGDNSTTFNVPDLKRRACIGRGGGGFGVPGNEVGDVGGEERITLTGPQSGLQAHDHDSWPGAAKVGTSGIHGTSSGSQVDVNVYKTAVTGPKDATEAHNNMQPSAVVLYIIKL
jgi:microcystin-dependent protein